jgi:transposase
MDKIYDKCCGVDVHKKLMVACFRQGRKQEIREFGATTRELLEMADWLKSGGCEMIAMESTGSYWKPLYNILETSDLKAMVVNAGHIKNVPGRKTDVRDAEWIADLLQHGLLKASYIPNKDQRELRELVKYRKSLKINVFLQKADKLGLMLLDGFGHTVVDVPQGYLHG